MNPFAIPLVVLGSLALLAAWLSNRYAWRDGYRQGRYDERTDKPFPGWLEAVVQSRIKAERKEWEKLKKKIDQRVSEE
jgi:hypothetical protein